MNKYIMKKWNVFVQMRDDSTKNFYCLVNAYSFDEALYIAQKLFPRLDVLGAQQL